MKSRGRGGTDRHSGFKPVKRIILSDEHTGLRITAVILLVLLAVGLIGFAVYNLVSKNEGWTTIEPVVTSEKNCTQEFVFQYELGRSGAAPTAEYKKAASVYTAACGEAYRLLSGSENIPGLNNVYYINAHPNEIITVEDMLYEAFELLEQYNTRYIYFAPVFERCNALFICADDYEAAEFDPYVNAVEKSFVDEVLSFVKDENSVSIELMGENKVRLNVSEAYLKYAAEQGIGSLINFFMLRNAFIIDYTAEALINEGFTGGVITSFDGYSRHLGDVSLPLSYNIFAKDSEGVRVAAVMDIHQGVNTVCMKDFIQSSSDLIHYYQWEDGQIRTPYVDLRDGMCKSSVSTLTAYSDKKGCARLALDVYDIYASDSFDSELAAKAIQKGTDIVCCADRVLKYSQPGLELRELYVTDELKYTKELIGS